MEKCVKCGNETKHEIPYYTALFTTEFERGFDATYKKTNYSAFESHRGAYCSYCANSSSLRLGMFAVALGAIGVLCLTVLLGAYRPVGFIFMAISLGFFILGVVLAIGANKRRGNDELPAGSDMEMIQTLANKSGLGQREFMTKERYEALMRVHNITKNM